MLCAHNLWRTGSLGLGVFVSQEIKKQRSQVLKGVTARVPPHLLCLNSQLLQVFCFVCLKVAIKFYSTGAVIPWMMDSQVNE